MIRTTALCLLLLTAPAAAGAPVASAPPHETADLGEGWYAEVETSMGSFLIRLLPKQAPQSVAHFAALAEGRLSWRDPFTGEEKRGHYYDGLQIHRVAMGRRFETGDPTGTGRGSPPIYVPLEGLGPENFGKAFRVGMTRAPLGKISGAQFFVTAAALPYLSLRHPCFGVVVRGRDVVTRITMVPTQGDGRPRDRVVVKSIRIRKVGEPFPIPDPVHYVPKVKKFGPRTPSSPAPR